MAESLPTLLERLVSPNRGKGRLQEAPTRDAIPPAVSEAVPEGDPLNAAGGIASPLTEQAYTGSTYLTLTSSDGLTVFEYPDETDYLDGNGDTVTVIHL